MCKAEAEYGRHTRLFSVCSNPRRFSSRSIRHLHDMTSVCFVVVVLLLLGVAGCCSSSRPRMVEYHELRRNDFSVKVTNWGATILSVVVPDAKGKLADVVLGYDTSHTISPYVNDTTYFGALVGRVANRVAGARFALNGKHYTLYPNDGKNSLHGGHRGFSKVLWTIVKEKQDDGDHPSITLYYRSFDGEQGFPGDLDVYVTYKIVADYQLNVHMEARPLNKPTPVNLAQHSYWNLGGHDSGSILSADVHIFGSHITPVDAALIPTGEVRPVTGTPFDFRQPTKVGSRLQAAGGGYDVNYVLDSPPDVRTGMRRVAAVRDRRTGRVLELSADQPGVQFYTGNMLKEEVGKEGYVYHKYAGLCLETQGFPNSVNQPSFPSQIVRPGEVYRHNMLYKFSTSTQ